MQTLKATAKAREMVNKIKDDHGSVLFLISGGCCDGSAPLCFSEEDFSIGENDILLGMIDDVPVYISNLLSDHYRDEDSFTLDIAPGRGGGFSLEAPYGIRFINRAHY
ncbi:DUF779 domain-containing protein [Terasakiella sp. A23]|uniref:DUF779 domain-containing protein n=1 Tax=Terasakiella sp. FCG-A23 TaxID=3080561 RepID=UPI0029532FCB|nr:DUF779 domain-containing protein [Terasakiella sp. A23]MDV7337991.1 DUF779 domain-containing protein [Terasakiella sp. A23]